MVVLFFLLPSGNVLEVTPCVGENCDNGAIAQLRGRQTQQRHANRGLVFAV